LWTRLRSPSLFSTFKRLKFLYRIIVLFTLVSCAKKEAPKPVELHGPEYYPLREGRFNVFECDSTVYTEIPRDTLRYRYQIKEVLGAQFTDDGGHQAWRLERFIRWFDPKKSYDSIGWTIKDVWQLNADNRSVQIAEENVRFTKLSFPVSQGSTWNGNAANNRGDEQYTYEYVDQSESLGNESFARVLKVVQRDFRTLISYEYGSEKYAADIGLIYRNYIGLYSNNIVPGQAVEQRIENGVMFTQTLIAHGYQ
jgi:hypothetical protein